MRNFDLFHIFAAIGCALITNQRLAATQTWDGGGANTLWNTANNWGLNIVPATADDVIFGSGFSSGLSINLNGNRTVNSLTLNTTSALSLTNSTLTLTSGNLTRNNVSGTEANQTINSGIVLGDNGTWTVNGSRTLFLGGNISKTYRSLSFDGAGALTISGIISGGYTTTLKNGAGTLTLSGANTFDGPMVINAGVVNLQSSSALGTSTYGNLVASGAALELQGGISVNEGQINLSGTGISAAGALRSRGGNNTFSGTVNLGADSTIASDAGTLTLSGSQALDYNATYTGAGNITLSGSLYGSGELIKSGSGTLTLTGSGGVSYGGVTRINQGMILLNKTTANTFNSNFIVGDGSGTDRLRLSASDQIANHLQVEINSSGIFELNGQNETISSVTLTGGQITTGAGTLTLGGNGPVTTLGSSSTATISGTLSITASQPVFSIANGAASIDLNVAANTTLAHGLTKTGAGTMKLSGTVTAGSSLSTDRISIDDGTILLGSANRISDSTPINFDGGTLATGGFNETVGQLTLTANSIIDFGSGASSLVFGSSSAIGWTVGTTLTISNWSGSFAGSGTDRMYVGSSSSGLTVSQLGQIRFANPQGLVGIYGANILSSGEIVPVPVPEPATIFALCLISAAILFHERKRLKAFLT